MDPEELRDAAEELAVAIKGYYVTAIIHGMVYYVWGGHHKVAVWDDVESGPCDDAKAVALGRATLLPAPPAGLGLEERSRRFLEYTGGRHWEYPDLLRDLRRVIEMPTSALDPEDWREGIQAIYEIAEKHHCWFYDDNPLDEWTVANRRMVHPIAPYQTLYPVVARLVVDDRAAMFFAPDEDPCPLIADPSYEMPEEEWFAEAVKWRKRMDALLGKVRSRALGELMTTEGAHAGADAEQRNGASARGRRKLSPCIERAYSQWRRAAGTLGDCADREAHDWLDHQNDIEEDELASYGTWARYVRVARRHYGTQKNEPRRGRATGGSVVSSKDI